MFNKKQPDEAHSPSRAEAIRDGVLVDASVIAREAGFKYGVALTRAVWEHCVAVPDGVVGQDEAGRMWDVIHMLAASIRRGAEGTTVAFTVHVRNDNRERAPLGVPLLAVCGPGDDAEPVITVKLAGED